MEKGAGCYQWLLLVLVQAVEERYFTVVKV
uniref:Uncharacterized protein n=1 Tax=Anguilla anguilla TaxID=7936 RepID=A0A0E9VJP9_ANGAN